MKKIAYIRILFIMCLAAGTIACSDEKDEILQGSPFSDDEFIQRELPVLSVGRDLINFTDDYVKVVSTLSKADKGEMKALMFFGIEDEKYVSITSPAFSPADVDNIFSTGKKRGFTIEYQLPGYNIYFVITEQIEILKVKELEPEEGTKCKRIWLKFVDPLSYKTVYLINDLYYY